MANENGQKCDLLLVVTSDRYGRELFGTVRRLIETALRGGYSVQIWACGYANMLTELSPARSGASVQEVACGVGQSSTDTCVEEQPSTVELISDLVTEYGDRFTWLACSTCSEERGSGEHIVGLPTPDFSQFRGYVDRAAKTVYIGGV